MDGFVTLGPLAFATDRVLAVVLLIGFLMVMDRIALRAGAEAIQGTGLSIVAGIVAARIAYVLQHRDAFAHEWTAAFAIWQGGFSAWIGFLVAAVVLVWRVRPVTLAAKGVVVLTAFAAAWFVGSAFLQPEPRELPALPPLTRLDGSPLEAKDLAGRPFVVNLWATWCPPCRRELPMLADMARSSRTPIILVNQGETPGVVREFLLGAGIPGSAILLDERMAMMRTAGGAAMPTTLFVNSAGLVVSTHAGEISRAALADKIAQLEGN